MARELAPPSTAPVAEVSARSSDTKEAALTARLRPWHEKFPAVPVVQSVVEGTAAELVRASAEAALPVLGRGHRDVRPDRSPVGPVTRTVLHRARCPVAVVPHA